MDDKQKDLSQKVATNELKVRSHGQQLEEWSHRIRKIETVIEG